MKFAETLILITLLFINNRMSNSKTQKCEKSLMRYTFVLIPAADNFQTILKIMGSSRSAVVNRAINSKDIVEITVDSEDFDRVYQMSKLFKVYSYHSSFCVQSTVKISTPTTPKTTTIKTGFKNTTSLKMTPSKSVTQKSASSKVTPSKSVIQATTTTLKIVTQKTTPSKTVTKKITSLKGITPKTTPLNRSTPKSTPLKTVAKKTTTLKNTTPSKSITQKTVFSKSVPQKSVPSKNATQISSTVKSVTQKSAPFKIVTKKSSVTQKNTGSKIISQNSAPVTKKTVTSKRTSGSTKPVFNVKEKNEGKNMKNSTKNQKRQKRSRGRKNKNKEDKCGLRKAMSFYCQQYQKFPELWTKLKTFFYNFYDPVVRKCNWNWIYNYLITRIPIKCNFNYSFTTVKPETLTPISQITTQSLSGPSSPRYFIVNLKFNPPTEQSTNNLKENSKNMLLENDDCERNNDCDVDQNEVDLVYQKWDD